MAEAGATQHREIVLNRLIHAPQEIVWEAWTNPQHLIHWWGPDGFTNTFHEIDVRPGGVWRFIMHGPDGTDYDNKVTYVEVEPPARLVYQHGTNTDEVPTSSFHVTVTFENEDGNTRLISRMVFDSTETRDNMIAFGAVEGGNSTFSRLDAYVQEKLL